MWLCLGLESEDVFGKVGGLETCNDNPFDISVVGRLETLQLTWHTFWHFGGWFLGPETARNLATKRFGLWNVVILSDFLALHIALFRLVQLMTTCFCKTLSRQNPDLVMIELLQFSCRRLRFRTKLSKCSIILVLSRGNVFKKPENFVVNPHKSQRSISSPNISNHPIRDRTWSWSVSVSPKRNKLYHHFWKEATIWYTNIHTDVCICIYILFISI